MKPLFYAAISLALLLAGCADDNSPVTQDEDGDPIYVDYTGDQMPRAVVPEDTPYDEVQLPLEQEGGDSGEAGITYAAVLGGYYLLRVQKDRGDFRYQYELDEGDFNTEENSIHRQCGSTITQAWMWRVTQRKEFEISTRRALDYLYTQAEEQDDGTLRLSNLGGTALLAIATSVYVNSSDVDAYDDGLEKLGQHILSKIDDEGEFTEGDGIRLAQGQAMMALEHLHAATGDEKYLDALQATADWYAADFERHKNGRYFGLWANEPLTYLYNLRPDEKYAEIAFGIGDRIVDTQHIPGESEKEEWEGGYESDNSEKPLWNTCLRLEAVIDAYRMAVLVGDEERVERYGQSAKWASAYLMRLQLRAGETDDMPEPDFVVGAVPFSSTSNTLRIDVTHHVAQSILKTTEYLQLEEFPGRRAPDEIAP